jgi:hypothetical protein
MSEHDYVIKLALGLLEECSKNLKVPNLIARIILNNLAIKVADGLLILTEEHKLWAKQKLISCRADLINDFVAKFELKGIVGEEEFKKIAQEYLDTGKYGEAAQIINEFGFHEDFDTGELIIKLIDLKRIEIAKMLADKESKY